MGVDIALRGVPERRRTTFSAFVARNEFFSVWRPAVKLSHFHAHEKKPLP